MRVNYLGPLCMGIDHAALEGQNASAYGASCYLVEVSPEAGVDGPLIEGDVLVVDEARPAQHDDLVIVEVDGEQRLFNSLRVGGQLRLIPTAGPRESIWARQAELRGVVVRQARQ